jgi:hypothetical protein
VTAYRIKPNEEFPDAWDVEELSDDEASYAADAPNIVVAGPEAIEHLFWELAGFIAENFTRPRRHS